MHNCCLLATLKMHETGKTRPERFRNLHKSKPRNIITSGAVLSGNIHYNEAESAQWILLSFTCETVHRGLVANQSVLKCKFLRFRGATLARDNYPVGQRKPGSLYMVSQFSNPINLERSRRGNRKSSVASGKRKPKRSTGPKLGCNNCEGIDVKSVGLNLTTLV